MSRRKRRSSATDRRGAGEAAPIRESDALTDALQAIRRTSQFLAAVCAVAALVMVYESYAAIADYVTPSATSGLSESVEQVSREEGFRLTSVAFALGLGWLAYLLWMYNLDVGKLLTSEDATPEQVVILQKKLWHGLGLAAAFSLLTGLVVVIYFFVFS
jgi:hypothetical protein